MYFMTQTNLIAIGTNAESFLEQKRDELCQLGIHVIYIDANKYLGDEVLDELFAAQQQRNIIFAYLNSWMVEENLDIIMSMWEINEETPADKLTNLRYVFILPFRFEEYSMTDVNEVRNLFKNIQGCYIDCEERKEKSLDMPLLDFINHLYDDVFNQIKSFTLKLNVMPRYRLTIKKTGKWNGVYTEKGMSVEVAYQNPVGPLSNAQNKKEVIDAFRRIYGIDLTNLPNLLNHSFMDVKKL